MERQSKRTGMGGFTMKTLNVTFTDKEFKEIAKEKKGTWHDYILKIVRGLRK